MEFYRVLASVNYYMRTIPKVYKHDLALTTEGVGSKNNKEYCKCDKCKALRERRNKIYRSLKYRIDRWFNLNF